MLVRRLLGQVPQEHLQTQSLRSSQLQTDDAPVEGLLNLRLVSKYRTCAGHMPGRARPGGPITSAYIQRIGIFFLFSLKAGRAGTTSPPAVAILGGRGWGVIFPTGDTTSLQVTEPAPTKFMNISPTTLPFGSAQADTFRCVGDGAGATATQVQPAARRYTCNCSSPACFGHACPAAMHLSSSHPYDALRLESQIK